MEIDNGCPQPPVFDDSVFGEYIWCTCPKRRRRLGTCPEYRCQSTPLSSDFQESMVESVSCDDDCVASRAGHHESRAESVGVTNSWSKSTVNPVRTICCCHFADHETLQLRPASMYDMTGKSWICVMDLRDAPAREFEAIRQRMKAMPPHMVVVQCSTTRTASVMRQSKHFALSKQTTVVTSLFNTHGRTREQDSNWVTSLGFWTILPCLIQSFAEPGDEIHLHHESARQVAEAAVESAIARLQRTGSARRLDGTFFDGLVNAS